jgi:5-methylcytosine-specific restriction protein A
MAASNLPALGSIRSIIKDEATLATGAIIITRIESERPSILQIGFEDLGWKHGPRLHVAPHGMHAYRVTLCFGNFSRPVFQRMNAANDESHELAISIVETAASDMASLEFSEPNGRRWEIGPEFSLQAVSARASSSDPEERIRNLSRHIIVPVMSALAELNGYDLIESGEVEEGMEGGIKISTIQRRERNPRNRLLAIKIHGTKCKVCEQDHSKGFGFEGSLVEVHHCQPLSVNDTARSYNPREDLVPLCPTCHRAAHKRRPLPYTVDELRAMLRIGPSEPA